MIACVGESVPTDGWMPGAIMGGAVIGLAEIADGCTLALLCGTLALLCGTAGEFAD